MDADTGRSLDFSCAETQTKASTSSSLRAKGQQGAPVPRTCSALCTPHFLLSSGTSSPESKICCHFGSRPKNFLAGQGWASQHSSAQAHSFIIPNILFHAFLLTGLVSFPSHVSWRHKLAGILSWVCIFFVHWSNFRITCSFEVPLLIFH